MIRGKSRNNAGPAPLSGAGPCLCGFGASYRATESFWCIGSKLCWANGLSAARLNAIVFPHHRRSRFHPLLCAEMADFAELSTLTGIPAETFPKGTGRCLTKNLKLLDTIAYTDLRFCPRCLASGFHSVLMQFPLFARCPIHRLTLVDHCNTCGCAIEYAWPDSALKAFHCACGATLWQPRQFSQTAEVAHENQMKALCDDSARWIARTLRIATNGAALHRNDMR